MMTTPLVQDNSNNRTSMVPPSVLLIGKKHATDYIAPGLFRLNNTGKLIIKATGSLSIVTAVDVAEIIKRDVENVITETIALGTDSLVISTGESKKMSCIEIQLSKIIPIPEPAAPAADVAVEQETKDKQSIPAPNKARKKKRAAKGPAKKKKVARKKKATAS